MKIESLATNQQRCKVSKNPGLSGHPTNFLYHPAKAIKLGSIFQYRGTGASSQQRDAAAHRIGK